MIDIFLKRLFMVLTFSLEQEGFKAYELPNLLFCVIRNYNTIEMHKGRYHAFYLLSNSMS